MSGAGYRLAAPFGGSFGAEPVERHAHDGQVGFPAIVGIHRAFGRGPLQAARLRFDLAQQFDLFRDRQRLILGDLLHLHFPERDHDKHSGSAIGHSDGDLHAMPGSRASVPSGRKGHRKGRPGATPGMRRGSRRPIARRCSNAGRWRLARQSDRRFFQRNRQQPGNSDNRFSKYLFSLRFFVERYRRYRALF